MASRSPGSRACRLRVVARRPARRDPAPLPAGPRRGCPRRATAAPPAARPSRRGPAALARLTPGRAWPGRGCSPGDRAVAAGAPGGGGRRRRPPVPRRRLVDDGALEGTRAPLVELQPAGQRLDSHLQVLHLDASPRRLHDQVVHQLVVQLIHPMASALASSFALGVDGIQARLDMQRLDQRVRVEEQLQDRHQQARIQRIGARCDSNSVASSNAKFGSSGGW